MESIVRMSVNDGAGREAARDVDFVSGSGHGAVREGLPYEEGKGSSLRGAGVSGSVQEQEPALSEEEKQQLLKKYRERRLAQRKRQAAMEKAERRRKKAGYRMIAVYVTVTVLAIYILLHLVNNAGVVLAAAGRGLKMAGTMLMPLFWGFLLAYILSPLAESIEKRLRKLRSARGRKGNREKAARLHSLAVALTCALVFFVIAALLSIAVSALYRSLRIARLSDLVDMAQSLASTLANFQQTAAGKLEEMNVSSNAISAVLGEIGEFIGGFTSGLSSSITAALRHTGGIFTGALFSVIFAVYFLLDGKSLKRYWNRVLIAVGGKTVYRDFHILAGDADAVFSGYIRGQLIDACIMALMIGLSLTLIGIPYAAVIGILSGIGNLVPYIGPVVAYVSTVLVCVFTGDLSRLLAALVLLFVIQTVDGNIINPRLLGSSIDIHPMLVIAALIIGGAFGGFMGMLFAVPVAGFLKIQFDKVIERLLQARLPVDPDSRRKRKREGIPRPDPGQEGTDGAKQKKRRSALRSSKTGTMLRGTEAPKRKKRRSRAGQKP